MSRRARPIPQAAPPAPRAFHGLRRMLGEQARDDKAAAAVATARANPAADAPIQPQNPEVHVPDEAERALFRQAVGSVQAMRSTGRADIERPRPPPQPRARASAEAEDALPATQSPRDALSLAYEGVVPLRAHNRVELAPPVRRPRGGADAAARPEIMRPDALVLPAETEFSDPALLFRQVVGDAQPMNVAARAELERALPPPHPLKREADERSALDESLAMPPSLEDRLEMGDEAVFLRPGLPRRVLTDLRRGRWALQGQIDLHGLTRDEARTALALFLHESLQQGKRCVRVIHGKGLGSPGKVSILKQLSRGWLAQREEILAFCQAGPHDGGDGALLVLMRARNAARN